MKSRKKKQKILIKTATRDYALLAYLKFLTEKYKKEIGIKELRPLYYYFGEKVRIYHNPPELEASFDVLRKKFQSKMFLLKIVKKLNTVLNKLKPYLEKKKEVKNKKELEELHRKFVGFLTFAELVQTIPDLKEIPKENREIALNARKRTHNLIIPIENLVRESLKKIMNMGGKEIKFLLPEEIFEDKKFTKEDLEKRSKGYIYYKYKIYTDKKIDDFIKKENIKFEDKIEAVKKHVVIKGQTAYPGKVRGAVKVVLNVKDIHKIEQGDILVADMTLPVYVPGMKKAAAFVTDEGGLGSHAAIFSREMKKPCIIGTKIATKVLKDGDLVEVDANKGTVKILKKA